MCKNCSSISPYLWFFGIRKLCFNKTAIFGQNCSQIYGFYAVPKNSSQQTLVFAKYNAESLFSTSFIVF